MNLVIHPARLGALNDAAIFYASNANAELGLALIAEFEGAIADILANPHIGVVFSGTRRRYLLRRFPYSIFYQVTPDKIRIVAVAHQRRRPSC